MAGHRVRRGDRDGGPPRPGRNGTAGRGRLVPDAGGGELVPGAADGSHPGPDIQAAARSGIGRGRRLVGARWRRRRRTGQSVCRAYRRGLPRPWRAARGNRGLLRGQHRGPAEHRPAQGTARHQEPGGSAGRLLVRATAPRFHPGLRQPRGSHPGLLPRDQLRAIHPDGLHCAARTAPACSGSHYPGGDQRGRRPAGGRHRRSGVGPAGPAKAIRLHLLGGRRSRLRAAGALAVLPVRSVR